MNRSESEKSSPRKRGPASRPKRKPKPEPTPDPTTRTGIATYWQLVKLTHLALDAVPSRADDLGELMDAVKQGAARWKLEHGNSHRVAGAIDSALFQRRHVHAGVTPPWMARWKAQQRAEQQRRRREIR